METDCDFSLPGLPLTTNNPLPAEAHLRDALSLARDSWALDFLFKLDPAADVGVLTSPGKLQYGVVVDTNASIFEMGAQYGGLFNVDFFWRWLIVPVMNVGDITAEIVVQSDERISNENFVKTRGITTVIRMLRSNADGRILLSLENPEHNEISLNLFRGCPNAARERCFVRARRGEFLEALWDPKGIDYRKMARSLVLSDVIREVYNCPKCVVSAPGCGCLCSVKFRRPKHPLDFAASRMNMMYHGGRFSGSCAFSLYNQGVVASSVALASRIYIEACEEVGVVEGVADMGVKSKMGPNAIVPRAVSTGAFDDGVGLSFAAADAIPGMHFESSMGSFEKFDKLDAFYPQNSLFGEPFGSSLGVSATSCIGGVETSPAGPCSGVLQIEPVPAGGRLNVEAPAGPAGETVVDRQLARQMKNREAAARSNLKRKQRNDALKRNLAAVRKRKWELEVRESELKLENVSLRKLVDG